MTSPRLLVRFGSMGDVVLATAAATVWTRSLYGAPLDVLVKAEWASLWEGHPAVRRIWAWESGRGAGRGLRYWAAKLRREGYGEALDLQGSPRSRALLTAARVPVRSRPHRHGWRRRALVRFKRGGPPPTYRVLESFLEAAGEPGAPDLPRLYPGPEARARARVLLGDEAPVAFIPGARHLTKRWPLDRYRELGKRLAADDHKIALFLGPDEEDLLRDWEQGWPAGGGSWVALREPLPVAAAALERCRIAVTGDTGLMHVAAAMGTPVAALFGPTVTSFGFAPAGEGHRVIEEDLPCRPCSVHGSSTCPRGHFRCMLDIPSERVFSWVASPPARTVSASQSGE